MESVEIWNEGYNIYASERDADEPEQQARLKAREYLLRHEAEGDLSGGMIQDMLHDYKETYEL